jgi:NADH:ubiquinone oxidoreductase subunit F (NADH-binding)
MTDVTILPTPPKWPRVLLPVAPDAPATPSSRRSGRSSAPALPESFAALRAAVEDLRAEGVLDLLEKSGLRGRGTTPGLPTGAKWRACATAPADRRYVVVNAWQSDPAVLTDRVLIERNATAVLEGAIIAAFAVGASEIVVALRAEAVAAVTAMEAAIASARAGGNLGASVLGSGVEIEASVRTLQGAYMLGEETVLLKGLQGERGQPEQQPPFTTTRGLFGKPTLIHGPQMFAAVPALVAEGAGLFAGTGEEGARGTILVQVSGAVAKPGIVEVPLGTEIGEILAAAGGTPGRGRVKALLVGGPSGALLPPEAVTLPYDQAALEGAGAHIGSGSITVIEQGACVVDLAAALTRFCADQACGKTIPCRIGLRRLAEIGARIRDGEPRGDELTRLADLSADIVESALCDHERRSTLALRSVVRYFRDDLDAHLLRNECPAGICHPAAPAGAVS